MEDMVTVLMTTYNEEKEIFCQSLESILNQSYTNIKILIIVDNKNNKDLINIIENYQKKDKRIFYVINEKNLGLAESLNKGIEIINTKYIARMDADDIAFKDRIEKQLKYAQENPQIDVFGCNICYIDYYGNILYNRNKHSTDCKKIKKIMKYINIFHHSTFFGKTNIFKKYKYRNITYSQDYDFICRLLEDNCSISNMNDYLLYYRLPKQVNTEKLYKQKISHYCIQKLFKENTLTNTDIKQYIEERLNNKNKKNTQKGFLLYNKAFEEYKKKHFVKFIFDICHSFFLSKYQRTQITNLIKYKILKLSFK